ncbi:MAG: TlpA family protein disulfide reductase [Pseudomonadota bacterium]|jgi:thiol-disulfide isomerase/thioredoxin
MGKLIIGALLLLGLAVMLRPETLPGHTLAVQAGAVKEPARTVGGACSAERCLTVYLAPWCPSCRRAEPMLAQLRAALARDGLRVDVVVGMDDAAALESYARSLGYPVLLDVDGKVQRDGGVRGVPYFIVTDRSGEVVDRQAGAFGDVESNRRALGL